MSAFDGKLTITEIFWRDHCIWLKECGYKLRPRLQPDWTPSWTGTNKLSMLCEDSERESRAYNFMDAMDMSSGKVVALKLIRHLDNPRELEIGTFLSNSTDPRNHCVPILRVLPVPNEDNHTIIVMPYLRPWHDPPFRTTGEGVQFFKEMLEALQFLHHHNIAHRDGGHTNIFMDATDMFPDSFHPQRNDLKYDYSGPASYYRRTERPPKYYFIDFGLSNRYNVDDLPVVEPVLGGDQTVPEAIDITSLCDPFAVDVYYLGNALRAFLPEGTTANHKIRKGLRGMKSFGFMKPLVMAMVEPDPAKRIKIDEAVERFTAIENGLSAMTLRGRVAYSSEPFFLRPFRAVSHWAWTLKLIARGVPAVPHQSASTH
ncbi:uncharacterized protein EV420DRAFT_1516065 [Desarmillaria tabescens]|uniref:Protein kinase domain-containing protein n=1 Tax=Armillaria tabescens TaxID=1929756 RepID=A0AA39NEV6_ARMTA|nr:uncharacterized protein EV420DRAFT_1516065 [Desarmillaria tabescens]KAK0464362.1 hypothetical protein EV420DRAFT_1516065 [Desarmillaria tabescens]